MVGASARAAAHSLVRAGYAPWAVDLFADRDLRLVAPCVRCPLADYPAALPSFAEQFPPGPVLYTGGLENHPEVVAELARRRLVQGNNPDALRKARDPFGWYWRPARGYSSPLTRAGTDPVPTAGRWLSKPLRSAGGLGIRFADPGEVAGPERYVQEYIDGPSLSAQFVTLDGETTLLGVTDQLTGEPWLHAAPFAYCGTIGPTPVSRELRSDLAHFGRDAAGRAGLRGVWGADFVTRDGNPHPVEVNPRYTASMEVLEHATGVAVLRKQTPPPGPLPYEGRGRKTRADRCLPPPPFVGEGAGGRGLRGIIGKAVYYAPHRITFPPDGLWDDDLESPFDPWRLPGYADIPDPGEPVEPGQPVLTFFATGSTADIVRATLMERAAELDRLFGREGVA